jgi:hypothetical protein
VQKLEKIDQLLLTLMKPRLNAPHLDVAQKFFMSQATVSNIFLTYIHAIHEMCFSVFSVYSFRLRLMQR